MTEKHDGSGLRFNNGKLRMELLPENAFREVSRVFTIGANKYGDSNWRAGMSWRTVIASLKRHTAAFERGEDFDSESGLLHVAHLATNALFLCEYYSIYPQGDDRVGKWVMPPKIGLDIDDVLADLCGAYMKKRGLQEPKFWYWSYGLDKDIEDQDAWEEFLLNLPRKIEPEDLPFEPVCYITSRTVPTSVTEQWIEKNGFPCVPVITVGRGQSKVDAAKKQGVDVFVDDKYDTFMEMNANGICCYLMDASHNRRYDVGARRIRGLNELPWFRK